MSLEKEFLTYLIKSNKKISMLSTFNGVSLSNYDNKFNLLSSANVILGTQTFIDTYFDIDSNDGIYGLINSKRGSLLYTYITDSSIIKTTILELNSRYKYIKFPYIKKINNTIHVFYYLVDVLKTNTCTLFHHFYDGYQWITYKISDINYFLLTNFIVKWTGNTPSVFFFKKVNNCSELFVATYKNLNNEWTAPYAITNTKKEKVYLSIIKKNNKYHITYAESNNSKYYCIYFNAIFANNLFVRDSKYLHLNKHAVCSFPNLISKNNNIYLQWVENTELLSRKTTDNGDTWSDIFSNPKLTDSSFYRCQISSSMKDSYLFFGYKNSTIPII